MKTTKKILSVFFVLLVAQHTSALKPRKDYVVRPENYDLIYKELDITTADGYTIKTWFYPAQELLHPAKADGFPYLNRDGHQTRPYQTIDDSPKPTIIICDGDAENMGGWIGFAPHFLANGYNVVNFDWRGFGESAPFPTDTTLLCYPEYLIDYKAVIDSVAALKEVDSQRIGVYGASTGAYLSFATAHTNPHVTCFAGRALMTSFDDFLPYLYKVLPYKRDVTKKPENYPAELFPINIAPHFTKPVFLIIGEKDTRTPVSMSKKIYKNLKTKQKKLWIVKGAEHGGGNAPEYIDLNKWNGEMVGFFDKYLKNK